MSWTFIPAHGQFGGFSRPSLTRYQNWSLLLHPFPFHPVSFLYHFKIFQTFLWWTMYICLVSIWSLNWSFLFKKFGSNFWSFPHMIVILNYIFIFNIFYNLFFLTNFYPFFVLFVSHTLLAWGAAKIIPLEATYCYNNFFTMINIDFIH